MFNLFFISCATFLLTANANAFNVELVVEPLQPRVGQTIKLECKYDTDDPIYSIKFYLKNMEFYRFMPQDNRSPTVVSSGYLKVLRRGISVEIQPHTIAASGKYSCEVSTDAPTFPTVIVQKTINILPFQSESTTESVAEWNSDGTGAELVVEPQKPQIGQAVDMQCKYNIGGQELYSITFYKDDVEFYRYTPRETPSEKMFRSSHLEIIERRENSIKFRPINLGANGIYTCEVNCEGPTFRTFSAKKTITIQAPQAQETTTEIVTESKSDGTDAELVVEPLNPQIGQAVDMQCKYNIGGEELYSIKFYRNHAEFYRYMPEDFPSQQVFPSSHLEIIETRENSIKFRPIDLGASGIYTCEVSCAAPTFRTFSVKKNIIVQAPRAQESTTEIGGVPRDETSRGRRDTSHNASNVENK